VLRLQEDASAFVEREQQWTQTKQALDAELQAMRERCAEAEERAGAVDRFVLNAGAAASAAAAGSDQERAIIVATKISGLFAKVYRLVDTYKYPFRVEYHFVPNN
jgi:hypothetical protein